jgi:hypothetical protein
VTNQVIDFDKVAHGDMLAWAIGRLRTRLPEMLAAAGGADVVAHLDMAAIDRVLDDVETLAANARRTRR